MKPQGPLTISDVAKRFNWEICHRSGGNTLACEVMGHRGTYSIDMEVGRGGNTDVSATCRILNAETNSQILQGVTSGMRGAILGIAKAISVCDENGIPSSIMDLDDYVVLAMAEGLSNQLAV